MTSRSNQARQALDRVATSGEAMSEDEVKGLEFREGVSKQDIVLTRAAVENASSEIVTAKAEGRNAHARELAEDTAKEFAHLIADESTDDNADTDSLSPRELADRVRDRL